MTKNRNTFAGHQETTQAAREGIIAAYLKILRTTRVRTKYLTDLASLVAVHVAQTQGAPCSVSTLLRNSRYKSLLLSYMASKQKGGLDVPELVGNKSPGTQALVLTSGLKAANAERELDRINIYVRSLEADIDRMLAQGRLPNRDASDRSENLPTAYIGDAELSFIRTCQTLRILLDHFRVIASVDMQSRSILDSTKRRDNVIVGMENAGPFFDWLSRQQPDR